MNLFFTTSKHIQKFLFFLVFFMSPVVAVVAGDREPMVKNRTEEKAQKKAEKVIGGYKVVLDEDQLVQEVLHELGQTILFFVFLFGFCVGCAFCFFCSKWN